MFEAIAQSQNAFASKQEAMENQYDNALINYQQKKDAVDKYNKQAKDAARAQLNNLIGSDFAEAGIYTIQAGRQIYGQYKTARQARENALAGDESSKPNQIYRPGEYKQGVGGDVSAAPKPTVAPEVELPDIASGKTAPTSVSSSAQTDTPVMKLKGGVRGPLEEDRLIYDPKQPGMIKVKDEASEGGYRSYSSREDELGRQLDKQQEQLQKTSVTRRAARQRKIRERGGDPDDIDLPAPGEAPPRVRFPTDAPTKPVDFFQRISETPEEANLRRISNLPDFTTEAPSLRGQPPTAEDPEIPVGRRARSSTMRERIAAQEESGPFQGFDPRSGGVRPRSKTISAGTQAEPPAPLPEAEPPKLTPSAETLAGPAGPAAQAPPPTKPTQPAQPKPAEASQAPDGSGAPAQAPTKAPAPAPATDDKPPTGDPTLDLIEQDDKSPAPAPAPDDKPPTGDDDKPPTGDDDKPPVGEGEGGGGLGGGDLLGLAGLGYGIYEEAESSDSPGAKAANIAGQVGLFAGIEAAEMAVPGAGPVLGALTAVGFGLYDIFSKKHKDDANPAPVKGPPPVVAPGMAFDSAPTLDSSSFRTPLGGIVQ